jgi:hypothetical protein
VPGCDASAIVRRSSVGSAEGGRSSVRELTRTNLGAGPSRLPASVAFEGRPLHGFAEELLDLRVHVAGLHGVALIT